MIKLLLQMLESESLKNLFLKLVNMSISASWIVLAVLLLRLVLKKAPKWIAVLLWGIVALRLVCPFTIESVLSLIPSAQTVSPEIMMDWTPTISTGISSLDQVVNPIITQTFAPKGYTSANPLQILIPVASIVWLTGIAAMLIYTAVSYILLRRKVATAVLLRNHIYQSENVPSPFVLGILKPRMRDPDISPYSICRRGFPCNVPHQRQSYHNWNTHLRHHGHSVYAPTVLRRLDAGMFCRLSAYGWHRIYWMWHSTGHIQ